MSMHPKTIVAAAAALLLLCGGTGSVGWAQTQAATPAAVAADTPAKKLLSAAEMETLVARIALYPDDLVALVLSGALNPLQIVQAERFLEEAKAKPDMKPDADWDGSIVSLLNYPTVVKMMNDDLTWTQQLGDAVTDQEKDVLVAVQHLRDKAVANGVIKSDDKVVVEKKNSNVVIRPAKKEVTYVPVYDPVILTNPTYVATAPIVYGTPYPSYFYPYAPYWAGFVTGVAFGAAVDWDNWHSWGGNDVDIDINNFNRNDFHFDKDNINNLNFDGDKFKFDHNTIANNIRQNSGNRLDRKGGNRIGNHAGLAGAGSRIGSSDIRKDVQNGLRQRGGAAANNRPGQAGGGIANRIPGENRVNRTNASRSGIADRQRPAQRPAARLDHRPRQPAALGNYGRGADARIAAQRGHFSRDFGGGGARIGAGGGGREFRGGRGGFGGGGRFHRR